jgi:hypothetical protein
LITFSYLICFVKKYVLAKRKDEYKSLLSTVKCKGNFSYSLTPPKTTYGVNVFVLLMYLLSSISNVSKKISTIYSLVTIGRFFIATSDRSASDPATWPFNL